jgi:hypothetical protein
VAFAEGESEIEAVFEAVVEGQTRHGKNEGAIDSSGIDERGVLVGESLGAPLAGALDLTKTTAVGVPDLVTLGRVGPGQQGSTEPDLDRVGVFVEAAEKEGEPVVLGDGGAVFVGGAELEGVLEEVGGRDRDFEPDIDLEILAVNVAELVLDFVFEFVGLCVLETDIDGVGLLVGVTVGSGRVGVLVLDGVRVEEGVRVFVRDGNRVRVELRDGDLVLDCVEVGD